MTIRYFIAAALMAGACAAHADVLPTTGGAGSDALQALYQKISASVGGDNKISVKVGEDGVYVSGLSTAKVAALAGDGMSLIATPNGYRIVDNSTISGGGANTMPTATGTGTNGGTTSTSGTTTAPVTLPAPNANANANTGGNGTNGNGNNGNGAGDAPGNANGLDNGNGKGLGLGNVSEIGNVGDGNDLGNGQDATDVPEPSTIALMLAGMLGVVGLGRRRAR